VVFDWLTFDEGYGSKSLFVQARNAVARKPYKKRRHKLQQAL
jgi:hypothetical protein